MDLDQSIKDAWNRNAQAIQYQLPAGCGGLVALKTEPFMAELGFTMAVLEIMREIQNEVNE